MAHCFKHLGLMNLMIGFSLNLDTFPKPIYTAGFSKELIEPSFEGIGNPDLFFNSEKNGLICECKTNSEDKENPFGDIAKIKNYEKIRTIELAQKGVNITYEDKDIDTMLCVSANIEYKRNLKENGINYPTIEINVNGKNSSAKKAYGLKFKNELLETNFSQKIMFDYDKRPQMIPFLENNIINIQNRSFNKDLREELNKIISLIYSIFVSWTFKNKDRFSIEELAQQLFEDTWTNMDDSIKKPVRKKINAILILLRDSGSLVYKDSKLRTKQSFLKKIKGNSIWVINITTHPKRLNRFKNTKKQVMESLSQEKLIKYYKSTLVRYSS